MSTRVEARRQPSCNDEGAECFVEGRMWVDATAASMASSELRDQVGDGRPNPRDSDC